MKHILLFTLFILCSTFSFSQSAFDKALSEISSDLASKLSAKEKKKVVVLFITDINKAPTVAGKYVANIISINIVNDPGDFFVFDRDNLSSISEANILIDEGYIDVDKTKELGKILSVDAIIVGNYTVLSSTMKLTTKALDATNGFVIAASMKDLPLDQDACALLGISLSANSGSDSGNLNADSRGFNRPINSDEQYNNPSTVDKECVTKNIGDYCFKNNKVFKVKVIVNIGYDIHSLTLNPGQTQCIYNLNANSWNYSIKRIYGENETKGWGDSDEKETGQILVEKCKSKTFDIK